MLQHFGKDSICQVKRRMKRRETVVLPKRRKIVVSLGGLNPKIDFTHWNLSATK